MENVTPITIEKKASYMLGTNYTLPGSAKNFANFFLDKKNAKAIYTKYTRFAADRDLEMGLISPAEHKALMKELFGKRV